MEKDKTLTQEEQNSMHFSVSMSYADCCMGDFA